MRRFCKVFTLILALMLSWQVSTGCAKQPDKKAYYRIVVASDVHFPSKFFSKNKPVKGELMVRHKNQAVEDINSWQDVDLVAFTGDMIAKSGTEKAYQESAAFAMQIKKPKVFMTGNHEYFYASSYNTKKKSWRAKPEESKREFQYFHKYFETPQLYKAQRLGKYLLIFLSPDNPAARYPTEMSSAELNWLKKTLAENKKCPTIIFFHGPLKGTLISYTPKVNGPQYIAQPWEKIDAIIAANPQIKIWASGHTHTSPRNPSFHNKLNWYRGKVLDVHNPSWEGKQVWTNSLYLYPDRIVVKTYDHKEHKFIDRFTREIKIVA